MGTRRGIHHVTIYTTLCVPCLFSTTVYTTLSIPYHTCYSNQIRFAKITSDDLATTRTATTAACNDIRAYSTILPLSQSSGYHPGTCTESAFSEDSDSRAVRFHRDRIYHPPL